MGSPYGCLMACEAPSATAEPGVTSMAAPLRLYTRHYRLILGTAEPGWTGERRARRADYFHAAKSQRTAQSPSQRSYIFVASWEGI